MGIMDRSPSLQVYLDRIGKTPLLNRATELDLAKRCQNGDREAEHQLIEANLRFVVSVAKLYNWSDVPLEDRINAGNLGLIEGVRRYRPNEQARLLSYAVWWIRRYVREEVAKFQHIISSTTDRQNELAAIRKALATTVAGQEGQPLSSAQLQELGITDEQLQDALRSTTHSSIDAGFVDSDSTLHDHLADERSPTPDAGLTQQQHVALLEQLLAALTDEEAAIFRYLNRLDDGLPHTLREASSRFGMSTEKISARLMLAKRKLHVAAKKLTLELGESPFAD